MFAGCLLRVSPFLGLKDIVNIILQLFLIVALSIASL